MARTRRATVVAILVVGVVLGAGAGTAAFVIDPLGDPSPSDAATPGPSEPTGTASPSPSPSQTAAPLPRDCGDWFDGFTSIGIAPDALVVTDVIDTPARLLQSPADTQLAVATERVWCDVSAQSDTFDLIASFSVAPSSASEAVALREALMVAGAVCAPVSGGVLCDEVVTYDPDDPSTAGASDVHYFRDGVWLSASIQQNGFRTPQQIFRDAAAAVFPGLP